MPPIFRSFLILAPLYALSACSTLATDVPFVYEIDIDQGNVIDQSMINQLRPNMTKRQVIYVLGSPLVVDPFSVERWDYIYSEQPGGEDRTQKRIALFFSDNHLIHAEGSLHPQSHPDPEPPKEIIVDVPKREFKKTLYEIIIGWFTFDD